MKSGLIVFVVIATASAARLGSGPPADVAPRASGLCYQANKIICSQDCKEMFLCVMDEGLWAPVLIETCADGMFCNGNESMCTTHLSTCSPTDPPVYQVGCTATGHFPDPFDCTVYHNCPTKGTPSLVQACPSGWSYNALTTECDHSVLDGVCFPAGRTPPCSTPGQSGSFPENPNIYYICVHNAVGLAPELFKCAHGGQYTGGQCVQPDV